MGLLLPFQPADADYPNHLASPEPERLRLPPAVWLMAAMVVLCLVPRAMMAHRITSICPDGVLYIHAAKALDAGNINLAFSRLDLNIYPAVIAGMHRLGFDWETGATVWGIVVSSLVVLPLWGWLRRQFDDSVAMLACMLYAVHPTFIEWSPEVMRDPTFWLLFTLSIYFMWRAAAEVRIRYFIAAGATIILAALTRIEGVFLIIPLVLWTFWRWRALKINRTKLLVGPAICVIVPALIVLIVYSCFRSNADSSLLRFDQLERVQIWFAHLFSQSPDADGARASMTLPHMAWKYFPILTRGLSPIFALLMFGGLWGWRRVWARRDNQPLFYVSLAIMFAIWIHLWYGQNICPRYALPIVLMASPFAALGLMGFIGRLSRAAGCFRLPLSSTAIATVVFAVVFAANLTIAMTSGRTYYAGRRTDAEVGRWILREFERPAVLVGPLGVTPIASYYAADTPYQAFLCSAEDEYILKLIETSRADVVLLRPAKELTRRRCAALVESARRLGYAPVRPDAMPTDEPGFIILVRSDRKDLVK